MKKAAFLILLCLATTATFAQKRGKQAEEVQGDKAIEYLIIRAMEISAMNMEEYDEEMMADPRFKEKMTLMSMSEVEYNMSILGDPREIEVGLVQQIEQSQDPMEVLNLAGSVGFELESTNAVERNGTIVHFYYLMREND